MSYEQWEVEARLAAVVQRVIVLEELLKRLEMQLGKSHQDLSLTRLLPPR